MPSNVYHVQFGIVAKRHRHDMWLSCLVDGSEAAQALALHIFDLGSGKAAHNVLLLLFYLTGAKIPLTCTPLCGILYMDICPHTHYIGQLSTCQEEKP